MLYKAFAFLLAVGVCSFAGASEYPQQIVTSEVFYDYDEETQKNDMVSEKGQYEQRYVEPVYYETEEVVEQREVPVWPIAGTDADFKITCKENQGCTGNLTDYSTENVGNGDVKIVSKIGNGLIIENNINTKGTGWSGGPNISNGTQTPVGFDYECASGVEMPLLNREMMEDDGGTVLSMSRSPRKVCNKQPDAYAMFAQRAGFVAEEVTEDGVQMSDDSGVGVDAGDGRIAVNNDYVDAEMPQNLENQVRSWVVASGQTLREVLQSWCDKEGWDLVWTTPREYPIEASAIFRGRFVDVASALVRNFERATPVPYAKFYKGNRVLVISTIDE